MNQFDFLKPAYAIPIFIYKTKLQTVIYINALLELTETACHRSLR